MVLVLLLNLVGFFNSIWHHGQLEMFCTTVVPVPPFRSRFQTENRNRAHFLVCFAVFRSFRTISNQTERETGLYQSHLNLWPFVTFVTKMWANLICVKNYKNRRACDWGHKFKIMTFCDRHKCHKLSATSTKAVSVSFKSFAPLAEVNN